MAAPAKFIWTTQHIAFVKVSFWQRVRLLLRGWLPVVFEIHMAVPYRNSCKVVATRHKAPRVGLFDRPESVNPGPPPRLEVIDGGKRPGPKQAS